MAPTVFSLKGNDAQAGCRVAVPGPAMASRPAAGELMEQGGCCWRGNAEKAERRPGQAEALPPTGGVLLAVPLNLCLRCNVPSSSKSFACSHAPLALMFLLPMPLPSAWRSPRTAWSSARGVWGSSNVPVQVLQEVFHHGLFFHGPPHVRVGPPRLFLPCSHAGTWVYLPAAPLLQLAAPLPLLPFPA